MVIFDIRMTEDYLAHGISWTVLVQGVDERLTVTHMFVTMMVGWVVPAVIQYYRLERPLQKPFLAAIM